MLAAWAIGAGPFSYPAEAGLAIGGPGFSEFVMLEVHYNNPGLRQGVVDSSGTWHDTRDTCLLTLHVAGIKFHVSSQLRRHDAGIMELGLIYNNLMAVRTTPIPSATSPS